MRIKMNRRPRERDRKELDRESEDTEKGGGVTPSNMTWKSGFYLRALETDAQRNLLPKLNEPSQVKETTEAVLPLSVW